MSTSSSVMKLQHGGANNLISFSTTVVLTVLTVFIKHNQNYFEPRSWKSPYLFTQPSSEYFIAVSQMRFEGSA